MGICAPVSERKWTQREKILLSGLLVTTIIAAIFGVVLIRTLQNAPTNSSNLSQIPQKVTVTGNAQSNSTNNWETIEVLFGGPCTQYGTNIPVSTACIIQGIPGVGVTRATVGWLPLYGSGTGTGNGQFTAILQNNQTYYIYLSYWGNFQQTQRENCIAGLGLYPPQATSFVLHSTTNYYQMNSTISCAEPPETIYGLA
jgi:hypothetical protein